MATSFLIVNRILHIGQISQKNERYWSKPIPTSHRHKDNRRKRHGAVHAPMTTMTLLKKNRKSLNLRFQILLDSSLFVVNRPFDSTERFNWISSWSLGEQNESNTIDNKNDGSR